jgi:hypothetical protein
MALEEVVVIIGIASPIVGWGILVYQNGRNRGAVDTEVKNDIKGIKENISNINKTLGNGGYSGIKGDIKNIQVHCAEEMSALKTEVANLKGNGNGHGSG